MLLWLARASLAFSPPTAGDPPAVALTAVDNATATFSVEVHGETWFSAGAPASVRSNGKLYVADGKGSATSLVPVGPPVVDTGRDSAGAFTKWTWAWSVPGMPGDGGHFLTTARLYSSTVVFGQTFVADFVGTATGDKDKIISSFPSFGYAASDVAAKRGFLQFGGDMTGSGYQLGELGISHGKLGSGITGTAPLVIFDEQLSSSVVLSPFSNFMAASQSVDETLLHGGTLSYGVMGNVSAVPAGYELETVLVLSRGGISAAMMAWGDVLLERYGKTRDGAWDGRDVTLQYLGYSTDNGAFYYYNMEPNQNYETTMLDVAAYARDEKIPYKYWLADSWWYFKGVGDGVKNWTAMPSIFPHGLEYVWEQTGWLVQGHNRYWSANTDYAKQNGGAWDFLVDEASNKSLPVDEGFWDFLMRSSKRWGLAVYEQDWLDTEFDTFPPLTQSATLGATWLRQMATAAAANGIAIQYCMSHSRHILASVELPAVTQARASGDYHPGNTQWEPLGVSGLFAYALGIAPSKDNYWSTQHQPGYPSGFGKGTNEPFNRLQAAVLTLTKGPVCPSDGVNRSDVGLIMRAAATDGTLLSPGRPATKLDVAMLADALGTDGGKRPYGDVWWAPSVVSGRTFGALLVANLKADYALPAAELLEPSYARPPVGGLGRRGGGTGGAAAAQLVAVEANATGTLASWGGDTPLALKACGRYDFQLFNVAPREANGWALLGEVAAKWVGVSPARFSDIVADAAGISAVVKGSQGEQVSVAFAKPGAANTGDDVVSVKCVIPVSGAARVTMPAATCVGA